MPKLSLVLPTYNRAERLELWLNEHLPFLDQYDVEICVLNNASDDNTRSVLHQFASKLKIFEQEQTVFVGKNIIDGIILSEGKYIWTIGDTYKISRALFDEVYRKVDSHNIVTSLQWMARYKSLRGKSYPPDERLEIQGISSCIAASIFEKPQLSRYAFEKISQNDFPHTVLLYISTLLTGRSIYVTENSVVNTQGPGSKVNWSFKEGAWKVASDKWTEAQLLIEEATECGIHFDPHSFVDVTNFLIDPRRFALLQKEVPNLQKELQAFGNRQFAKMTKFEKLKFMIATLRTKLASLE